ncbi:hypothetical protein PoB_003244700 [Plakobranchus ocellatus]|uniref:Uncharacterized protein n=1 Tax=Plakobranchus ocellatus TaxID=259542 RepID=A0AAV4AFX8_9GAST|nr:hypothetical protein PoB_003244700 [Plakobranchus ocellatus]
MHHYDASHVLPVYLGGVGDTVACESALRSAGTLLSRVRAPPSAPRPDGGLKRSPCCGQAIYKDTNPACVYLILSAISAVIDLKFLERAIAPILCSTFPLPLYPLLDPAPFPTFLTRQRNDQRKSRVCSPKRGCSEFSPLEFVFRVSSFRTQPAHSMVISGFQALRQAKAPAAGFESVTERSLKISERIRYLPYHDLFNSCLSYASIAM